MRVLMIHNRYGESARGGAERVVERLVGVLHERGHIVEVCHRTTLGFTILERLPVFLRALWHCMDLCNVIAAVRLRARLRRTTPDIIHTHNLVGCGGLTPWVIRQSGIPWIHTLHDVQLITPSGLLTTISPPPSGRGAPVRLWRERGRGDLAPTFALERSFLGSWFRAIRRRLFGNPDLVTSPSRWLLELHREHKFFMESRDAVIGNPIGVAPTPTRSPSRSEGEKERGSFSPSTVSGGGARGGGAVRRFVCVGQIEGQKGILVLVEAFRQLRALYDDITLTIVGSGTLLPMLKRMSRDVRGLVLRGRLDADGVRAAIGESDVLVVPSLIAENQPSVILEAFASGIPVIASRVGGIPELIQDGETGFLVDPGSVEDLLRVLRFCVEDPKRIRGMAVACHTAAAAHATDRIAIQLEEVYTAVSEYAHRSSRESMGSLRER